MTGGADIVSEGILRRRAKSIRRSVRTLDSASLAIGAFCLLVVLVVATAGALFTPDPFLQGVGSSTEGPSTAHILGTDQLGRDVLARIAAGTRYTLIVSVASLILGGVAGTLLGILSGYYRTTWGRLLDPGIEFLMSFPGLLFGIIAAAVFGNNLPSLILAIGIALVPRFAVVVRAETFAIGSSEFVDGARVVGVSTFGIGRRHILRNIRSSVVLLGIVYFPLVVTFEASLSYLGLGVPPDVPTLGRLIGEGQDYFFLSPGLSAWPGLILLLTCLGFNMLSDAVGARTQTNI